MVNTDPPPSYDSVISTVSSDINGLKDPHQVLAALKNLSPDQIDVLVANSANTTTSVPADKQEDVSKGMAQAMSDPANQQAFLDSAKQAADAAKLCEHGFVSLVPQLSAVDSMNQPPPEGPFLPRFKVLHQRYYDLINQSSTLATTIATYAEGFEALIVPFAANASVTTQQRIDAINQWEQSATDMSTSASQMQTGFFTLQTDFGTFIGTFKSWAQNKIGQLNQQIRDLDGQLADLNSKLTKINASLIAFGVLTAAALPITGVVAAMSGPAAPVVIVVGLIVAGVAAAITVGLVAGRISVLNQIASATQQRKDLQAQATELQNAQDKLVSLGNQSLTEVNTGIATLLGTWGAVQTDCTTIKGWLAQGATVASIPLIMQTALDHGNTTYKTMADYLHAYTSGINSAGIKPPQYIAIPHITSTLGRHAF